VFSLVAFLSSAFWQALFDIFRVGLLIMVFLTAVQRVFCAPLDGFFIFIH
jgi:hypothetical protein